VSAVQAPGGVRVEGEKKRRGGLGGTVGSGVITKVMSKTRTAWTE